MRHNSENWACPTCCHLEWIMTLVQQLLLAPTIRTLKLIPAKICYLPNPLNFVTSNNREPKPTRDSSYLLVTWKLKPGETFIIYGINILKWLNNAYRCGVDDFSFAAVPPNPVAKGPKCPGGGGWWEEWVAVRGGGGIIEEPSAFRTEMHFQFSR